MPTGLALVFLAPIAVLAVPVLIGAWAMYLIDRLGL